MIASFDHNFIFLKTVKTGGTSVEIVLSSWCKDGDICTPIAPVDEITRREFGGCPRGFARDRAQEAEYLAAIHGGDLDSIDAARRAMMPLPFYNHMPASEIAGRIGELWGSAFKFCIERHPYEKAVSLAYWRMREGRDFATVLNQTIDKGDYADSHRYRIDGKVAVDRVLSYESMWADISAIGASFGRQLPATLPRAKGKERLDRRPATEILTADQKHRIYERSRFEFEELGLFRP